MIDYEMRRKERLADLQTAERILEKAEYGVLSTVGSDGFPYVVPLNFAYDGKKIYFHCAKNAGHKQANLDYSDKVCFTVVDNPQVIAKELTTRYGSAVVFGTAEKTENNKRYALELLAKKYAPDLPDIGKSEIEKFYSVTDIYEISIIKISAKVNR